jgi:hypothetical protein
MHVDGTQAGQAEQAAWQNLTISNDHHQVRLESLDAGKKFVSADGFWLQNRNPSLFGQGFDWWRTAFPAPTLYAVCPTDHADHRIWAIKEHLKTGQGKQRGAHENNAQGRIHAIFLGRKRGKTGCTAKNSTLCGTEGAVKPSVQPVRILLLAVKIIVQEGKVFGEANKMTVQR